MSGASGVRDALDMAGGRRGAVAGAGGAYLSYRNALEALQAAASAHPCAALEQALVDLSIASFRESRDWPDPMTRRPAASPVANGQLAEIDAQDLDADILYDAVIGGGGLIVRGLMDAQRVATMRGHIDEALATRRDAHRGEDVTDRRRWYSRSREVRGGPQQFWASNKDQRYDEFGSIWTVDSPVSARAMSEFYRELGLPDLLRDCFGEEAVLSVKKWVLRKVKPKGQGQSGWHQDGRFLGDGIRTINLWVALSHCGGDAPAPGMEIVADNSKHIFETGTRGAMFDWVVGHELVDELARTTPVLQPEFQAGDALFFDHYNLHRTQCNPAQTLLRYAVESWFFAASSAPRKQMPLLL